MGTVKMPNFRAYWANETGFLPIADIMPRNRFEVIKKYFHVANNDETMMKPSTHSEYNVLQKVETLINTLRSNL